MSMRDQYITPYTRVCYAGEEANGFIAWRLGTGGNVELLHIKTKVKGKGHGRRLFYKMLDCLRNHPPYYSVFGFTRVSNEEAQSFYGALGFDIQDVAGVYADGRALLFWQSYETLLERMNEYNLRS